MSAADRRRLWVPVLLYHRVAPEPPARDPFGNFTRLDIFESQLRWLRIRGYRTVSLASVAGALDSGPAIPGRSVVITFDDGYRDNLTHAWPALRRNGFGATIFVVTDAVGGESAFDRGFGYEAAPMLRADEIRHLRAEGAEIGSHSRSHPITLTVLDDGRLREELSGSRRALEEILDQPVVAFSYPHSRHDSRVEEAVERAGYVIACGGSGTRFDRHCVSRVIPPTSSGPLISVVASWRRLKWLARGAVGGRAAA